MSGGVTFDTGTAVDVTKAAFGEDIENAQAAATEVVGELGAYHQDLKEATEATNMIAREFKIKSWRARLRKWFKKQKKNPEKLAGEITSVVIREGVDYALRSEN
jgi:hypothetical protein